MIKWSSLQLNLMPVIAMEVDSAIQKLQDLVEKVSTYGNPTDIEELNAVRKSILKRIQSLDRFYQQKYQDDTVHIFHMLKLKLQRAIFKLGHINNDTISSDMITDMFARDSRHIEAHRIKGNRQSKSPGSRDQHHDQTFNHSNPMMEDSHHHDLLWAQNDSYSYDFGSYHDPLFKKDFKRQSPSSPELTRPHLRSKDKTTTGIKGNKSQNFNPAHQKIQIQETSKISFKQGTKIQMQGQKPQLNPSKNSYKALGTSYKEIKPLKKQTLNRSKHKQKNSITSKNVEKVKTQGNERVSTSYKNRKSTKFNKQLIKQEPEEDQRTHLDDNEFRFTIKMTREEYQSLQALRQELVRTGQLPY